ncbi:putative ABC-type phosphate transporter [Helianthus debilis subsp. tardiflorus]
MFRSIPTTLSYYWRMRMPETARYTALVAKNAKQATQDMSQVLQLEIKAEEHKVDKIAHATRNSFGLFLKEFARRHGLELHGITSTKFLLDITFYSNNLFQKDVLSDIGWIPSANTTGVIGELYQVTKA